MALNIDELLAPLSADSPCGEDLSYDPAFVEIQRMAQGTPETQVGDFVQQGQEPDWKALRGKALELSVRSKDLRLILYLTLSSLCLEGISGLRDGLMLLRGILEQYWEDVFPRLDSEDNNDPLERMNVIASLSPPATEMSDRETMKFKARLLAVKLCRPADARVPAPSLRDVLIAAGDMPPAPGGAAPDQALVDAAFQNTPVEHLQGTECALAGCLEHLDSMDTFLVGKVTPAKCPDLSGLERLVKQAHNQVTKHLGQRGYMTEAMPMTPTASMPAAAPTPAQRFSGGISSKEDVLRAFDQIAEFYERHEPSSPVPLLVRRARRLVGKSFVDIIRDLSPDAMSQVNVVSGQSDEKRSGDS